MKKIIIGLMVTLLLIACGGKKDSDGDDVDIDAGGIKLHCVMDTTEEGGSNEFTAYYDGEEVKRIHVLGKTPVAADQIDAMIMASSLLTKPLNAIKGFTIELSGSEDKTALVTMIDIDYQNLDWEAFRKIGTGIGATMPEILEPEDASYNTMKAEAEEKGFTCE